MKSTNSSILSKRRVDTSRPGIKHPSKPSPTTSPISSGEIGKHLMGDEDEIQSVYSFPSNSSNNSPIASPESFKKLMSSSHSADIIPCSELISRSKPKLKLYFGPKNITPFTNVKRQRNYKTLKTSLIMELKLMRPNFQDLLTILETVQNSVNERDDDGMTALMLICSSQVSNLSTAERLAFCRIVRDKFPKQFELTDNNGLTALHHAVQFMPSPSLRIVQLLLSVYPTAASILDVSQSLPLHHAVVGASSNSILKLLVLAHPPSVSLPDGTGLTAFDYVKSKIKIPSRRTRALLSVDGVWIDPDAYTTVDTNEPDPEENYAAIFLQHWFRQIRKKVIVAKHSKMNIDLKNSLPSHYKQSIRPKPKAPISTLALSSWHHDAATIIQALYRGSFLRMRIAEGKKSIIMIQRIIRGFLCRIKLWKQDGINYKLVSRNRLQRNTRRKLTQKGSHRASNWEKIERHSVFFDDESSVNIPDSTEKRTQSATKIGATWRKYKAKCILPPLLYRKYLLTVVFPFYIESFVILLFYLVFFSSVAVQSSFLEKKDKTFYLLESIHHYGTQFGLAISPLQFVQHSIIFSMVLLVSAIFTLRFFYLIRLKKDQHIQSSTKLFQATYHPMYKFMHFASLLSLTITWLFLCDSFLCHYRSLLEIVFTLPYSGNLGGIILSLLVIPLILYLPGVFALTFMMNRKDVISKGHSSQK